MRNPSETGRSEERSGGKECRSRWLEFRRVLFRSVAAVLSACLEPNLSLSRPACGSPLIRRECGIPPRQVDRKSVVEGKSVDLGGWSSDVCSSGLSPLPSLHASSPTLVSAARLVDHL